ncbi:MAG: alpha/beta fold hydrolase [Balneolaceae bacterium]|nr:alpha/beta fold hydrolase [Balneolaceae bacterium]
MKKGFLSTLILILGLYAGVCVYFYFIQNAILFNPTVLASGHEFNYNFNFEERWFEIEDEARIHAIHAKADSSKGLVIFFHGNGGSAQTNPSKFMLFLENGYDVLYPDYRGYGITEGEMWNEEDLVGDMKVVYQVMTQEYPEDDIVIVGYSLGSGVAAQVAAANDPREVILWTPYYSMLDMKDAQYWFLPDFLVRYPLRTDLALQTIEEPITIFYAAEDELLPVDRAMKLNAYLDGNDEFVMLAGQGHNRVFNNEVLKAKMAEILLEE